jgi:hypothetical protein
MTMTLSVDAIAMCRQQPFQNGQTISRYRVLEKLGAPKSELIVFVGIERAL